MRVSACDERNRDRPGMTWNGRAVEKPLDRLAGRPVADFGLGRDSLAVCDCWDHLRGRVTRRCFRRERLGVQAARRKVQVGYTPVEYTACRIPTCSTHRHASAATTG
jgi:hypothetical protein